MTKIQKLDNNLIFFFYFAILFSPSLAMLSGLFMAPWIGMIMVVMILIVGFNFKEIRSDFSVTQRAIIMWTILSCIWSISPLDSLFASSRLILVFFACHLIEKKHHLLKFPVRNFTKAIGISLMAAASVFLIEKFTNGVIIGYLRGVFQPFKGHYFYLYWLDRGCAMLSVFAWIPIYLFVRSGDFKKACASYVLVLFTLLLSDSDASILAFIFGAAVYGMAYFLNGKFKKVITVLVLGYIFLMPTFSKVQDPRYLAENPVDLPISYTHRLFIWNFAMDAAKDTLFIGKGIDASKAIDVPDSKMITYRGVKMSPMPRHPHNNVIQIFLELGVIGLILFGTFIWKMLDHFSHVADKDRPYGSAFYGMFVTYFTIGMISFNMWQSWWLLVILYAYLTMNLAKANE